MFNVLIMVIVILLSIYFDGRTVLCPSQFEVSAAGLNISVVN
jgi:hypothetical protein